MSYSVADLDTVDSGGPGGMVRFVRKALGTRAFGHNYFVIPADTVGREHDHAESGQEEVYFVVRGSGTMRIDGTSKRVPVAGPDGLELYTVGAPIEERYEPPPWG